MSLRGEPLEQEVTLPDGRVVAVRIGVAEDSYIPRRELDTVTAELFARGRSLGVATTLLEPGEVGDARELAQEIAAGLEAGTLEPTAAAIEPLADRTRR